MGTPTASIGLKIVVFVQDATTFCDCLLWKYYKIEVQWREVTHFCANTVYSVRMNNCCSAVNHVMLVLPREGPSSYATVSLSLSLSQRQ